MSNKRASRRNKGDEAGSVEEPQGHCYCPNRWMEPAGGQGCRCPLETVNCQSTSCCFTSVFCVSCKFLLISNLSWYHKGEEKKLQFSWVGTIANHRGNMFSICLRKETYTVEPCAAQHGPECSRSHLLGLGLRTLHSRSRPARETHWHSGQRKGQHDSQVLGVNTHRSRKQFSIFNGNKPIWRQEKFCRNTNTYY